MKHFVLVLFTLLASACSLFAADEDELKAVHKLMVEAAKTGNLQMLESAIHPQALGFMRESQFPIQLKPDYGVRDFLPPFLADLSRFLVTPYESIVRVVGGTGVVCVTNTAVPTAPDPKTKKKGDPRFSRATYIYAKTEGRWKLVSWHTSETPLKSKS